ncbi:hypothetical protein [Deinococcus arenicola]|uniref:Uncharacterized protein n=1 Tax=Deinococcus arenicola TaxID=2994950 RepID=A0ABU4DW24_9DEIO|nr:hypothetical protein [Deinococcus sp. ZS9-10]MDV6376229.1 hypothetical protein [Deinococcus sp. ZS9-10]
MTPLIYPTSSTTLPRAGMIDVPCYAAQSFNGKTALLQAEGPTVPFDFATLSNKDVDLARSERAEMWSIQGLIVVDVDWLIGVMEVTATSQKMLGAEIEEVWYYISPINTVPTVVAGHYVVIGLYR